jgi:hypothetical protein
MYRAIPSRNLHWTQWVNSLLQQSTLPWTELRSKLKLKPCYERRSVGQSIWCTATIWGPFTYFYYWHAFAGLLKWGTLSDERMLQYYITAAGPRHRSHFPDRVPQDAWLHFPVSNLYLAQPGESGPHIQPRDKCLSYTASSRNHYNTEFLCCVERSLQAKDVGSSHNSTDVLRDNTQCGYSKNWCFEGAYRVHLQSNKYVLTRVTWSNIPQEINHCKIWGFHGGDYELWRLLGSYAVWLL